MVKITEYEAKCKDHLNGQQNDKIAKNSWRIRHDDKREKRPRTADADDKRQCGSDPRS